MSGRTMIAGVFSPDKKQDHVIYSDGTSEPTAEAKILIADEGKAPEVITYAGEAYAKLPEGWPAAEAKDLEEAHAKAVMTDDDGLTDVEREIYDLTPGEVKELLIEMVDLHQEVTALRKGMKTMQRKTRKQAQQQRRLERRLNQARAGREQLRATAKAVADRRLEDAVTSLAELIEAKGLIVREGE